MQNVAPEPPVRLRAEHHNGDRKLAQPGSMHPAGPPKSGGWLAPILLVIALVLAAGGLAMWKVRANAASAAAAASQPEHMETISVAAARPREHRRTTTSIGTIVATRSVTLRNELPGTVSQVMLNPGEIVEPGTVLVALDVSVEEAELKAQEAQAALAETLLSRMERAVQHRATSQMEVDRARAERDVAQAQIARAKAIIARKTIRAPFRARVGLADVHPGQYLEAGTLLTTLQGVDDGAYVDFSVTQQVGQTLQDGTQVEVVFPGHPAPIVAKIIALDSRTDPVTRNTTVRARIEDASSLPPPGASVRVRAPVGEAFTAVAIPVSALRKGPAGDHVFLVAEDKEGKLRASMKPVQSGAILGDEILVLSGLNPGDRVAASGSFKLQDGVLVSIAAPQPAGDQPVPDQH